MVDSGLIFNSKPERRSLFVVTIISPHPIKCHVGYLHNVYMSKPFLNRIRNCLQNKQMKRVSPAVYTSN